MTDEFVYFALVSENKLMIIPDPASCFWDLKFNAYVHNLELR